MADNSTYLHPLGALPHGRCKIKGKKQSAQIRSIHVINHNFFTVYILTSWLPGFARDPPSPPLPFVPPFCPPSLGLPGFGQNIWSVIAQNNSIPEIHFKKMMLFSRHFMPFPDFYFFTPYNSHCDPPGVGRSICLGSKPFPARAYIRMCVGSWIYRQNITDIAKQRNMCVDF